MGFDEKITGSIDSEILDRDYRMEARTKGSSLVPVEGPRLCKEEARIESMDFDRRVGTDQ
jgi:ribosome recycling factor